MPILLHPTRLVHLTTPNPPKASGSAKAKMMVRLFMPINDVVRRASLYRGQMSDVIVDVLRKVDLNSVPLIDAAVTRGKMLSPTTISVDEGAQKLLRNAARRRGCSMNLLINSALAERFRDVVHILPMW
jgi:hypothetical protein